MLETPLCKHQPTLWILVEGLKTFGSDAWLTNLPVAGTPRPAHGICAVLSSLFHPLGSTRSTRSTPRLVHQVNRLAQGVGCLTQAPVDPLLPRREAAAAKPLNRKVPKRGVLCLANMDVIIINILGYLFLLSIL